MRRTYPTFFAQQGTISAFHAENKGTILRRGQKAVFGEATGQAMSHSGVRRRKIRARARGDPMREEYTDRWATKPATSGARSFAASPAVTAAMQSAAHGFRARS
jgi:hypothetical protein